MVTEHEQDFLEMEASKSRVSLKVGCLPYAVGKQPLLPMINLEKMNVKLMMMMIDVAELIYKLCYAL